MAINETISTGNKYRRLKDATNKIWQRISFWTKASDVEFDNGTTLEASLGNIQGITDSVSSTSSNIAASAKAVQTINSNLSSFQTGVDALYDMIVSLGVTPTDKTLAAIKASIQSVHDTGYAKGYSDGYAAGDKTHNVTVRTDLDWSNDKNSLVITVDGVQIHSESGEWQTRVYTFTV